MAAPLQADLVSPATFGWLMTVLVLCVGVSWVIVDTIRLRRALRDDTRSPVVRDRIFGSIIGLAISAIGLTGAFLYHLA